MKEDQNERLIEELQNTNKLLKKFTSTKYVLLRGIVSGLGGFIGATLLIAIILGGLSRLVVVPILGDFITQILDIVYEYQQSGTVPTPH